jgi:hypothetical protein
MRIGMILPSCGNLWTFVLLQACWAPSWNFCDLSFSVLAVVLLVCLFISNTFRRDKSMSLADSMPRRLSNSDFDLNRCEILDFTEYKLHRIGGTITIQ